MNLFATVSAWFGKEKKQDPNYIPELDIGIGVRPALEEDYAFAIPFPAPLQSHGITRVAVMAHIYYPDLCTELLGYINHIPVEADLYISTDTPEKKEQIATAFAGYANGKIEIRIFPNRGRDIAPKWVGYADVYSRYDYFLHIHGKKSLFNEALTGWREYIYSNLLGSREIVSSILRLLERDDIGIIFPQHHAIVRKAVNWGHCFRPARTFLERAGITLHRDMISEFPSGSMFWAKSAAFRQLLDLHLKLEDFEEESGQLDGTMAHVLEHCLLYFTEAEGYRWVKVATEKTYPHHATLLSPKDEAQITDDLRRVYRPLLLPPNRPDRT